METKKHKTMIGISIFAVLLCIASIGWIISQSYYILMAADECNLWHEDLYPIQYTIFYGRLIFKSLFYLLIIAFLFKQLKAIKNGVLFPRGNVKILYGMALSYFIGNTCDENVSTALLFDNRGSLVLNSDTWIYVALLIVLALIYKVAVSVSEENNLTI